MPAAGNVGRFQYAGQKWVAELALYDYKARMYVPRSAGGSSSPTRSDTKTA
jgi:hypothetical protein